MFSGVQAQQIIDRAELEGVGKWKLDGDFRRNLKNLRYQKHLLEQTVIDQFQYCIPTEVLVYTTRGGKWPERRSAPSPTGGMVKKSLDDDGVDELVRTNKSAGDLFQIS